MELPTIDANPTGNENGPTVGGLSALGSGGATSSSDVPVAATGETIELSFGGAPRVAKLRVRSFMPVPSTVTRFAGKPPNSLTSWPALHFDDAGATQYFFKSAIVPVETEVIVGAGM